MAGMEDWEERDKRGSPKKIRGGTHISIKLGINVRAVARVCGKYHPSIDHRENYRAGIWSSFAANCYSSPDRLPGDQRPNTKGRRGQNDTPLGPYEDDQSGSNAISGQARKDDRTRTK
ncbi:hypothetical protein E2C01_051229 [Portunus trituberculatus]|uniref:Uncharacterized protein n=1 Tax=Portunus trituberculatus TaxID=210409 RepID=A0A5B7GB04_PORTR|nr:hypothetical protein [Portunus trituberculatus]